MSGYPVFERMTKKDSQEFLQRFLGEMEPSLKLLYGEIESSGSKIPFNFTPESLIPLWEFFTRQLSTVQRGEDEIRDVPDWIQPFISTVTFDSHTKLRIVWVSFYFAKVVLTTCPAVTWGIGKGEYKNQPVLVGFKGLGNLCTLAVIENKAWGAVRGTSSPTALYDVFQFWRKQAPCLPNDSMNGPRSGSL